MIDLHPEMIAIGHAGSRRGLQRIKTGTAFDDNVAGTLHVQSVDHHAARD
jgi:hypothetical protein